MILAGLRSSMVTSVNLRRWGLMEFWRHVSRIGLTLTIGTLIPNMSIGLRLTLLKSWLWNCRRSWAWSTDGLTWSSWLRERAGGLIESIGGGTGRDPWNTTG